MHTVPWNRHPREIASSHRLQHRALVPDLVVASHADISGRDAGRRRFVDGVVAITAVHPVVLRMVPVVECDGLGDRLVLLSAPGRAHEHEQRSESPHEAESHRRKRESCGGIAPRGKEGRHAKRSRTSPHATFRGHRWPSVLAAPPRSIGRTVQHLPKVPRGSV
jgi:hypothetical protein